MHMHLGRVPTPALHGDLLSTQVEDHPKPVVDQCLGLEQGSGIGIGPHQEMDNLHEAALARSVPGGLVRGLLGLVRNQDVQPRLEALGLEGW